MKKQTNKITALLFISFLMTSTMAYSQVGIGIVTPNGSSILDIQSNDKGVLQPRLTTVERDAISTPANGLIVYNTTTATFNYYNAGWKCFLNDFILPINGGTGIANDNTSTLTLSGGFPTTIATTASTAVVLPATGTLYGTATGSITATQLAHSVTDETGTGSTVFSESPAFTGVPTGITATIETHTSQLATTAFVFANINPSKYSSVTAASSISTASPTAVVVDGMTLAPETGLYVVTFNSQYTIDSIDKMAQSIIDLNAVYRTLVEKTATNTSHGSVFGNGETLTTGVYSLTGAGTIAGTLTLDALDNPNAVFIFKIDGAFSSTAGTIVKLINGATASNVFWVVEGAIGMGASTTMKGMLLAHNGAVALGASSNLEGTMFTISGAIGIDNSIITIPTYSSYINLGMLSSTGVFSASGSVSNTGVSTITGDIGTNEVNILGFETAIVHGTINLPSYSNNALATFSIYQNGILIPDSTRIRTANTNTVDISLQAVTAITSGQAIDIRWKIDFGTITLKNRILTLINVR